MAAVEQEPRQAAAWGTALRLVLGGAAVAAIPGGAHHRRIRIRADGRPRR